MKRMWAKLGAIFGFWTLLALLWAGGNILYRISAGFPIYYATELREGGTMALGTGVPAVAHDLLNAVVDWEKVKDKYVYETWLREAKARLK